LPAAGTALRWRWGQLRPGHRSLGINVRLLGCVGQDRFGDLLLDTLRKTGVDIRGVERSPRSLTGILYINVTRDGQRTFFGSRGANQFMRPPHVPAGSLLSSAAAHLVGYSFLNPGPEKIARQILRQFHSRGKRVSLDVGMEPSKRIPKKNPPTAPAGGSSLCKQR